MSTASHNPAHGQLSLGGKLDLIPAIAFALGTLIYAAITGIFRGDAAASKYDDHVVRTAFRYLLRRLNVAQFQYIGTRTVESYKKFTTSHGLEANVVDLPSGIKGLWLGSKNARNVLLFFHGGGFVQSSTSSHFEYLQALIDSVSATNKDFAVFIPAYTLAPEAVYPTQIKQGVDSLRYLLSETKRLPANVIMGGDSAGGNLAIAVLSHLSHPHPSIPALEISEALKGMLLVSPWTSASLKYPSIKQNRLKDLIPSEAASIWMNTYKGGPDVPSDPYIEAVAAPDSWWQRAKTQNMIVTAGNEEILLGCIADFVDKYKVYNNKDITYVVGKSEAHDGVLSSGIQCETGSAIDAWLKGLL